MKGKPTAPIGCLDIGGTRIKSGVWNGEGLEKAADTATPAKEGGAAVLAAAVALARAMPGIAALGVSTAGEVDPATGAIRLCDNIPGYTGLPLRRLLQEALGMPVTVENDVNAAALGEAVQGAGRGFSHFIMLNFGTGIGGAVVLEGKLYRGAGGSAGEFGGLLTHPHGVRSGDRGSGSFERYASTTALVRRAHAADRRLRTGREVMQARADPHIAKIIAGWLYEVSLGLVSLIHAFDPQAVLLGGGIMEEPALLEPLRANVAPMLKPSFKSCRILPAALGNRAGLIGAAQCAQQAYAGGLHRF